MSALERRTDVYLITSESTLIDLYSPFMSIQRILEVSREVRDGFVTRTATSPEETNLQMLAVIARSEK